MKKSIATISLTLAMVIVSSNAYCWEGYITDQPTNTSIDEENGLQWQNGHVERDMSFDEANAYCTNLNWFGISDGWRLPTTTEMRTLTDLSVSPVIKPVIEYIWTGYWTNTYQHEQWRSKRIQFTDDEVIVVPFDHNGITNVVCVRDYTTDDVITPEPEPVIITVPTDGNEWKVAIKNTADTEVYVDGELAASANIGTITLGVLSTGTEIEVLVNNKYPKDIVLYTHEDLPAWELWYENSTVEVDVYDPPVEQQCTEEELDSAYQSGVEATLKTIPKDPCDYIDSRRKGHLCRIRERINNLINKLINKNGGRGHHGKNCKRRHNHR